MLTYFTQGLFISRFISLKSALFPPVKTVGGNGTISILKINLLGP